MSENLLLKRVQSNSSMENVKQLLVGIVTITVVYLINFFFIQNHSLSEIDAHTIILLLGTVLILSLFIFRKKNERNQALEAELRYYFGIENEQELEILNNKVTNELKNHSLFTINKYRITGTKTYVIIDTEKKNFQLLPAQKIKKLECRKIGRGTGVLIQFEKEEQAVVIFKNEREACKLTDYLHKYYLKNKQ